MAQIADVMHASVILDAAHQELLWLYWNRSYGVGALVVLTERMAAVLGHTLESREEMPSTGEAEKQSIMEWLILLKEAGYGIRAMVAELMLGGSKKQTPKSGKLSCLTSNERKSTTVDRDHIIAKLEKAEKQLQSLGYTRLPLIRCKEQQRCADYHETNTNVYIGRDQDKQRVINLLGHAEAKAKGMPVILPIFGIGGVGKTALARMVFHDSGFQDYTKAWVDLPPGRLDKQDLQQICSCIKSKVAKVESYPQEDNTQKLLLVLDDQWVDGYSLDDSYGSKMDTLKRALCDFTNVVVIVTTPSEAIAEYMCNTVVKPYQLHPLSDYTCWEILKRTSDSEAGPAGKEGYKGEAAVVEMDRTECKIVSRCGGLPSAAQALGCLLRSEEWSAHRKVPDIWKNIMGGWYSPGNSPTLPLHRASMLSHLKPTYQRLPIDLRFFFALCAFIFPGRKGHSVEPCDLMNQLDALACYPTWSHIAALVDISFLLRGRVPTVSVTALTMNDLVYDLARYVLGERLVVVDGRNKCSNNANNDSSAYCALIRNWDATLANLSGILPAGVLALRFECCSKAELCDTVFSSTKHLRLLDLSGCFVRKLPDSVGLLEELRYLNAPGIQNRVFPLSIINGVSNSLRYLSLRGSCQLMDLTKAFGSIKYLVHLDLSGCSGLKSLPESFGTPGFLQHLDLSGCSRLKSLPISLGRVSSNLRHLDLSQCSCLGGIVEFLGHCTNLRYLNISHRCWYSGEDWFHLNGLDDVLSKLTELRFLGLSWCLTPFCYTMSPEESSGFVEKLISDLVKLEHLDLSNNKFLLELPKTINRLKGLRTLDLSGCFRLRGLPESIGELKALRILTLSGCPQLNPLPVSTQQQLAELELRCVESHQLVACSTNSHEDNSGGMSLLGRADHARDRASTSKDASRLKPSSEITEILTIS